MKKKETYDFKKCLEENKNDFYKKGLEDSFEVAEEYYTFTDDQSHCTGLYTLYLSKHFFIANEPENCHIFSVANEWLKKKTVVSQS